MKKRSEFLQIQPLDAADAEELSRLILRDSSTYRTHFTPFAFDVESLTQRLAAARQDQYWGVRIGKTLAGFFMLRGFEEGYRRPAFGVYIGEHFAGSGLAALALHYALSWCRLHDVSSVMLKVHPENSTACHVYERAGFAFESVCPKTKHHILVKVLRS